MAQLGFYQLSMPPHGSNQRQSGLHQTGIFEGRSTNWTIAPHDRGKNLKE